MIVHVTYILTMVVWFLVLLVYIHYNKKYLVYMKQAFSAMKKIKILFYCVPLFISVLFAVIVYPIPEGGNHLAWGTSFWIVMIGIMVGVILFNVFESDKIKRSDTGTDITV